jgi:hypothetical protein
MMIDRGKCSGMASFWSDGAIDSSMSLLQSLNGISAVIAIYIPDD